MLIDQRLSGKFWTNTKSLTFFFFLIFLLHSNQINFFMGLAQLELTFPTAVIIVLCSACVASTTLILHQCFVHCWTVLALHQDSPKPLQSQQPRVGKKWGRDIARTADLHWLKGYSTLYGIMLNIKAEEGEEGRDSHYESVGFPSNHYIYWGPDS